MGKEQLCCNGFKIAVVNGLIKSNHRDIWEIDKEDVPINFCPWCGEALHDSSYTLIDHQPSQN